MFGAHEFIKHRLPDGAVYSEIIWTASVGGLVKVEYGNFGAQWILINALIISADDIGGPVTFIDAFGLTLFQVFEVPESSGSYDFWLLMKGSTLKIQASSATILFSVGHQYITKKVTSG